jgi:hypothetical protein
MLARSSPTTGSRRRNLIFMADAAASASSGLFSRRASRIEATSESGLVWGARGVVLVRWKGMGMRERGRTSEGEDGGGEGEGGEEGCEAHFD